MPISRRLPVGHREGLRVPGQRDLLGRGPPAHGRDPGHRHGHLPQGLAADSAATH